MFTRIGCAAWLLSAAAPRYAEPPFSSAPWATGGQRIGFDLAINDNDLGTGHSKQQLHWSGSHGLFWRNCQRFGTLLLLNR